MFQDYVFRPVLGFLWLLLFILVCFAPEGAAKGGVFAPWLPARAQDSEDRKLFLVQDSGAAEASEVPAHSYYAQ